MMKNALCFIAVALAAAAAGCGRVAPPAPAPAPDNAPVTAAPPVSNLFCLAVDLRDSTSVIGPDVYPLSALPEKGLARGGGSATFSSSSDGEATYREGSSWSCSVAFHLGDRGVLSITGRLTEDGKKSESRAEMKTGKGSTAVLLLPKDGPRYVFVFCVVPYAENYSDNAARRGGPYLLGMSMDWNGREPRVATTEVIDLADPDYNPGSFRFSSISIGDVSGFDDEGHFWSHSTPEKRGPSGGHSTSRKDEKTVSYSADVAVDGQNHRASGDLPIEKGKAVVALLPREAPRFAWVFCILPDPEPGARDRGARPPD